MDNTSGKAFFPGAGAPCDFGGIVVIPLQDACNPPTKRLWKIGWPGIGYDAFGLFAPVGYEFVATHELGHMLGLPDTGTGPGVMVPAGYHTTYLFLHALDRDSIQVQGGTTLRRAHTSLSASGTSWTAPSQLSPLTTSFPPGMDGTRTTSPGVVTASNIAFSDTANIRAGISGSWTTWPAASAAYDLYKWASVANTPGGQTLVVWPDDCTQGYESCDIDWAWTNNAGVSWTRGTYTSADTFSKVYVEYDEARNRFVMAYLETAASRVHVRSAIATAAPVWVGSTTLGTNAYRHLGGMVFDASGNGLLVASSNAAATKGHLAQVNIGWTGSTYSLVSTGWLTSPSALAVTRRPFGVARNPANGRIVVVWQDSGLTRSMGTCNKTGTSTGVMCSAPIFPISNIVNGVDLAFDRVGTQFVAGFTQ